MAKKDTKEEKFYTAEEVAVAVLKKAQELLKASLLFKGANSSHELETGEEPNNDDAECPPSLEEADIEDSGAHGEKKSKKSKGAGIEGADKDADGDIDGDDAIEAQEEQTGEDLDGDSEAGEPKEHKEKVAAAAQEPKKSSAPKDKDADAKIADASKEKPEEDDKEDDKKGKKPPFAKSEEVAKADPVSRPDTGFGAIIAKDKNCAPKPSLKKFMLKRKMKKSGGPTADSRAAEKLSGAAPAPAPQEKIKEQPSPAAKVKAQPKMQMEKNKSTEKLLGISPKAGK